MAALGCSVIHQWHTERDGSEGIQLLVAEGTAYHIVHLLHTHVNVEGDVDTFLLIRLLLLMA